ncbi:pyridoxamine 5'-phosphate oxidase family protein [Clostridium sporogenes]|jgi:nitroimidazol reductase NimA-like FMN-containing flavoprotein (pyridoxamine 5'-phosphate oxidase superfamily)|uniref:pyridoxamine 5'-phosphate oxidase family protein n=1 Tax=Clostridium sporogenes TaxID=1509 RepID=UPI00030B8B9D|nr:pyridoxamine 5'-phosphate oxidase family protein [Clostridium sporogenes]NFE65246.1 pyridoxamine 5'-phosphate oxidase family protein [Clostridium sporogenes]NFG98350.1 pyridoxamine 5'-phosphate oxidase family protein [Clostridium sporogenes]NFH32682.1 pyridoxamine 5'-phosphate oxidase family protein [Clostridium sporogenes]NFL20065.1 pyridoxamine 5'-phosphate oxidase family protein [Clostridium sporogenes]NFN73922.1 pyridoxamine 5'-phosphate oxidase family protein [Clostridium sporogenes]
MQYRMKTHPLSEEGLNDLLSRVQTGSLATLNADGTPYNTPVHFVHINECIYVHGLPKGQKIDNIIRDSKVGFTVYDMQELLLDANGKPCDTNTKYESAIATGSAALVEDMGEKKMVLQKIVEKYTPHLMDAPLPENMVRGTAVIRISIAELTGKYYE